jgi:hypothetical protein
MQDLFKGDEGGGEGAGGSSGGGGGLPPKWQFQQATGAAKLPFQSRKVINGTSDLTSEQIDRALKTMADSPLARSLAHISPNILTDLRIPASRALIPYTPKEDELKSVG